MVTTRSQDSTQTSSAPADNSSAEASATASVTRTPTRQTRNRGASPRTNRHTFSPSADADDTIEVNPDRYRQRGPASPSAASDHSVKEKLKKTSINPGASQRSVEQKPGEDDDGEDESMGSSPGRSGGSSPMGRKRTYEDSNEGSQEENDTKERLANSPPPRKQVYQPASVSKTLEERSKELAKITQDLSGAGESSKANGQGHVEDTTMTTDEGREIHPSERKRKASSYEDHESKDEKGRVEGKAPPRKRSRDLTDEDAKAISGKSKSAEAVDTDIADGMCMAVLVMEKTTRVGEEPWARKGEATDCSRKS